MKAIQNIIVAVALSIGFSASAQASDIYVDYVRNYDGDTVTVNLVDLQDIDPDGTYSPLWYKVGIRVSGVDTPEMRAKCPEEKVMAKQAKYLVRDLLKAADHISIRDISRGKYFRLVADIIVNPGTPDELNIKDALLEAGLAVPYDGGRKTHSWCE
jgi:endonuclease YncB( thermonuclease family)